MAHQTTADKVLAALEAHGLKKKAGVWRCNNPFIPNSDSEGFALTIHHGEAGVYYDHAHTEYSGSLYDLAAKLNIETPAGGRVSVNTTKRDYIGLADYASAHGTPLEPFVKAGWEETTQDNRRALKFRTAHGDRYRFIDGEKPTYKSQFGYKACWYGVDKALQMAKQQSAPLILCNGEATTVVAQHYTFPAAAQTGGEKELAPELLAALKEKLQAAGITRVWLCFDCDETGKTAARKIKVQLTGLNIQVTIVDLGLGDTGDLADFCLLYQEKACEELYARASYEKPKQEEKPAIVQTDIDTLNKHVLDLKRAVSTDVKMRDGVALEQALASAQSMIDTITHSYAKPRVQTFSDLSRASMEALRRRRESGEPDGLQTGLRDLDKMIGRLLPGVYILYGATNMGKSTLAVSIAKSLVGNGAGLIASTESPVGRWFNKLVASLSGVPSERIENGDLTDDEMMKVESWNNLLSEEEFACEMLDSGSPTVTQLRAAALKKPFKWAIVDSLSKMEAPGMSALFDITRATANGVQALAQELNIPIICTSQIGRDVADRKEGHKMPRIDDGFGGSIIEHNADVIVGVYNHAYYVKQGTEQADDYRFPHGTTTLSLLKHRWIETPKISVCRLKIQPGVGYIDLHETTVDVTEIAKRGKK